MSRSTSDSRVEGIDPRADFFTMFGFARTHALARDAVEDRYLELARLVHPDRVATDSSSDRRRAAMERSAAVNEGYRVLRDPIRRAEYLVKLGGVDLDSSDSERGAPHPTRAFLVEMIERREQADAARRAGAHAVEELRVALDDEMDQVVDRAIAALQAGEIRTAAEHLVARRYLQRLADELDDTVEVS